MGGVLGRLAWLCLCLCCVYLPRCHFFLPRILPVACQLPVARFNHLISHNSQLANLYHTVTAEPWHHVRNKQQQIHPHQPQTQTLILLTTRIHLPMSLSRLAKTDRHYFPFANNLADTHRANVYSQNARHLNELYNLTDVDDSQEFACAIGNNDYMMPE